MRSAIGGHGSASGDAAGRAGGAIMFDSRPTSVPSYAMPTSTRAQFVISIDLEMSWGSVHHGRPHDDSPYRAEREIVADVLSLMERHRISATWAIVGHLFLAECSSRDGHPHPEVTPPQYPWLQMAWYDLDPTSDVDKAPTWYGPDLVAAVRNCSQPQEVGSHSFGHLIAGDPACSAVAFRTDTAAAKAVALAEGIDLRSYVYPRNSIGHLDELAAAGFHAYRGNTPERFPGVTGWRRKATAALDTLYPLPSATVHAVRRGDLVDVPQTYLFDPASTTADRFGTKLWSRLVRRRLRHAVRTGSLFHLWFHTHNFSPRRKRARVAMDELFREAREHIDAGRLENLTMGELADRILVAE